MGSFAVEGAGEAPIDLFQFMLILDRFVPLDVLMDLPEDECSNNFTGV